MNKFLNPKNYIRRISTYARVLPYTPFYRPPKHNNLEANKFDQLGLDEKRGLERLNRVLRQIGRSRSGKAMKDSYGGEGMKLETSRDFDYKRDSIHWLLFACLSLNGEVRKILELGTFDGSFTAILSRLFPNATITTVDLPPTDPALRNTYGRDTDAVYQAFVRQQQQNLSADNIRFLQVNSFFLPAVVEGPFDIIWVDGDHSNPVVAWDLCNAYHLCRPGGLILCDDVIPTGHIRTEEYSIESFEALSYIGERVATSVTYFLKRRHWWYSAEKPRRKFVSYMARPWGDANMGLRVDTLWKSHATANE